ncbi:MAG: lysyl-tRNA synthetase class 2, partial [Candidatus Omnitrophota bacterium]
ASGINPYGGRVDGLMPIKDVLAGFEEGKQIKIAGRIMAWRSMGKVIFADLVDQEAKIQLFIKPALLPEGTDAIIKLLDIGDILAIEGELFVTKTEMQSVKVSALSIQSKALRPLPEKWHGLKKVETRYRQRYLDLASNMEIRKLFQTRSKVVSHIRRHLDEQRYLEVETPMMHSIPGGAAGKPFKTHHNALDIDLYMRIAPELYLKRLLVGGLERVYEINKSFRNEGISTRHNPEFTMLEVYTAYSDVEGVMDLCQSIIQTAAKEVLGTMVVQNGDIEIDLAHFDRVSFADLMQEEFDIRPEDELEVWAQKVRAKGIEIDDKELSRTKLVKIIGDLLDPAKRKHPVFVTDYFTELCPLAKKNPNNPGISERFELFIGGIEIANGYSELNDPIEQMERFKEDIAHDDENDFEGLIDVDFVRALEHGMPPAGGLGIGIDRMVMILTGQTSIREVLLFPQLKPE